MLHAWIRGFVLFSFVGVIAACNRSSDKVGETENPPSLDTSTSAPSAGIVCAWQAIAESVDLAEASGATFLSDSSVLLIGDSGTKGAYVLIDPSNGELLQKGQLPLDSDASDDLEGVSVMDERVYAITSSGWMREWSHDQSGFTLFRSSYALAASERSDLLCSSASATNCAKNYEGLCLLPKAPPAGQCAGFAAAKASGELICLTLDDEGKLTLDAARSIQVAKARTLSGCDFDEQGRLWFGNNFFAANKVGYVENWQSPAQARVVTVGNIGLGFPEAIALGKDGLVIRASDTSGSPSLLSKYICR